jgi:hypothetical protein
MHLTLSGITLCEQEATSAHPLETPYDFGIDEPQLSYHGSNLVTTSINPLHPPFPTQLATYEGGNYLWQVGRECKCKLCK